MRSEFNPQSITRFTKSSKLPDSPCLLARRARAPRTALDQLQNVPKPGLPARPPLQPIDLRDVRMIQRGENLRFLEAREAIGIERQIVGQDLERDITTKRRVARSPHLTFAASAERADDFIWAEANARLERHRLSFGGL